MWFSKHHEAAVGAEVRRSPLPEDVLRAILDAGRRAQSSKNTQPWDFVVIQDRERLTALSKLGTYAGHLAGAAAGLSHRFARRKIPTTSARRPRS